MSCAYLVALNKANEFTVDKVSKNNTLHLRCKYLSEQFEGKIEAVETESVCVSRVKKTGKVRDTLYIQLASEWRKNAAAAARKKEGSKWGRDCVRLLSEQLGSQKVALYVVSHTVPSAFTAYKQWLRK